MKEIIADNFEINDQGTIVLVTPLNERTQEWLERHTDDEALWTGPSLVVEPRYLEDLLYGFYTDHISGLTEAAQALGDR